MEKFSIKFEPRQMKQDKEEVVDDAGKHDQSKEVEVQ